MASDEVHVQAHELDHTRQFENTNDPIEQNEREKDSGNGWIVFGIEGLGGFGTVAGRPCGELT